jgi:hypothetical protein
MSKKELTTIEKLAADHRQAQERLQAARDALERAESTHQAAFEAVEALRARVSTQPNEPSAEQRSQLRSLAAELSDAEVDVKVAQGRTAAATTAAKSAAKALRDEELKAKVVKAHRESGVSMPLSLAAEFSCLLGQPFGPTLGSVGLLSESSLRSSRHDRRRSALLSRLTLLVLSQFRRKSIHQVSIAREMSSPEMA